VPTNLGVFWGKVSLSRLRWGGAFGAAGVCLYFIGFLTPYAVSDRGGLLALVVCSILALGFGFLETVTFSFRLLAPIFLFLFSTIISILLSGVVGLSANLAPSLIPAVLLYFLVAGCCSDAPRLLPPIYFTLSCVSLTFSLMLLWIAWSQREANPVIWMSYLGSRILAVPNDLVFLAVIAPLSLALVCRKPLSLQGSLSLLSAILSVVVICVFQSRTALVALLLSACCFAAIVNLRFCVLCVLAIVIMAASVDVMCGFRLSDKFTGPLRYGGARIWVWLAAWRMFLEAPLFGRGPYMFSVFFRSYLDPSTLAMWPHLGLQPVFWAHNLYLEVLAGQGLFGLISFLFLLFSGISTALRTYFTSSYEVRLFALGGFSALIGFSAAAVFDLTLLRQWVAAVLFTLTGITIHLSTFRIRKVEALN
jgi:O-antigen ligase